MPDVAVQFSGAKDADADSDGPFYLGSTAEWLKVVAWAEKLPEEFDAAKTLASDGEVKGTDALAVALEDAVKAKPPDAGVLAIVNELRDKLGNGAEDETATITTE